VFNVCVADYFSSHWTRSAWSSLPAEGSRPPLYFSSAFSSFSLLCFFLWMRLRGVLFTYPSYRGDPFHLPLHRLFAERIFLNFEQFVLSLSLRPSSLPPLFSLLIISTLSSREICYDLLRAPSPVLAVCPMGLPPFSLRF